eukprot:14850898-Alexandrium_andersonii.AAC.1
MPDKRVRFIERRTSGDAPAATGASLAAEGATGERPDSAGGDDAGLRPVCGGGDAQLGNPDGGLLQVHLGADDPDAEGEADEMRWMVGE